MTVMPRPTEKESSEGLGVKCPMPVRRRYPMRRLARPQMTFTGAGELPLPGGEAKGVGNFLPEMPLTKCGTQLARNAPAKKWAKYMYHSMGLVYFFRHLSLRLSISNNNESCAGCAAA